MCGVPGEPEAAKAAALLTLPLGGSAQRIPWLGSLLELAGANTPLMLELKVRAGTPAPPIDLLCRTVAGDIRSHPGPVGVMSFDPRVGAWFARHAPEIPRGLVIAEATPAWRRVACWEWRGRRSSLLKQQPRPVHGSRKRGAAGRSPAGPCVTPRTSRPFRIGSMRLSGRAMADHDPVEARIANSFAAVDASIWDQLAGSSDPFLSHAFFATLEKSGSIGGHSGWTPLPLLVSRGEKPIGAAPAFLKSHSQGEYVFDQGWADAWQRAGGDYYPKLQIAVPFTPVVGRRLLGENPELVLAAAETVVRQNDLLSAHVTFLTANEAAAAEKRGWLVRHGVQFHWQTAGERDFDGFLERCSSRKRKVIRKERAAAREGLAFRHLRGAEIGAAEMDAMWLFYQDTGSRKWGRPYLTRAFFHWRSKASAITSCCSSRSATASRSPVRSTGSARIRSMAATGAAARRCRFFTSNSATIRRSTGRSPRPDDRPGRRTGEHKLARGYEPVLTYSAHFIPNAAFRSAVADFLRQEREAVANELEALAQLPLHKN